MFTPIGFFAESGIEGLLDLYPSAYAAWSLRKLRNGYSGAAIQVTRTSDSTTQDIGFDADGNLDESALTSFIGANTGVVSIWYDQSGNGRDIDIPSAKRPTIVDAGTLQTLSGGKPTMKPQTGVLGVDTGLSGLTNKTIFFAGDSTNQLGNAVSRLFSGYAGTGALGDNFLLDHVTGGSGYVRYFDGGASVNSQTQVDGEVVIGGYTDGGNIGVRVNNTTTQTNTGASPDNTQNYHLFEDGGGSVNNEIPTFASEYIIYDSAKDSDLTDIMTNIDGYYSILPPINTFSDAQYWWRADHNVGISGGNVTSWTDVINGYQLSGVIGNPTKTTEAALNGVDVIDFDGSDALYATSTPASRTGDFTILAVYHADTLSANEMIFGISRRSGEGLSQFQHTYYTSTYGLSLFSRKFGASGADLIILEEPGTTGAHAFKGRYDASEGDVFAALDTLTETAGGTTGNTNQDWDSEVTFAAGAWVDGTSGGVDNGRYFNGKIAEMVMVYGTPSDEEMTAWKNYVNDRYGTIIS